MKAKIIRVSDNQSVDAKIIPSGNFVLPSLTDGWRFNFKKHAKQPEVETYILVSEESPTVIEGCLIFQMKNKEEPYMAYVEIAPHNSGKGKKYTNVGACLIAFACRLSFLHGKGPFHGWLSFDVLEESKDNEVKLMAVYCVKYGALRFGATTMVISPEVGERLINQFLK